MDLEKNKLTDAAAHALTDHLVASPEASVRSPVFLSALNP